MTYYNPSEDTNKPPPPPRPQPPQPQPAAQKPHDPRVVDMETTITRLSNDNRTLSAQNDAVRADNLALSHTQTVNQDTWNNQQSAQHHGHPQYMAYNQGQWRWHDDEAERERRHAERADRKRERAREKSERERERREREVKRTMDVLGAVAF